MANEILSHYQQNKFQYFLYSASPVEKCMLVSKLLFDHV